jgi:hypothetical protein
MNAHSPPAIAAGSERRFCSSGCRHTYRTAAARWAIKALETLKAHQRGARAFGGQSRDGVKRECAGPLPDMGEVLERAAK